MGSLKDQEKLDQRPDMKEAKGSCEHRASTSKGERSVSMPDMNFGRKSVSETEMPGLGSLSQPCTKTPAEYTPTKKPAPFKMRWINGFNHKVGVINLNDKGNTIMFYAASNCGVLYNWTTHKMWLLQGHRHLITCITADANGKWLVTADAGPENVLIIWDSSDLFPQRTIFAPHGTTRIAKVAMSNDAKYLITLAYPSEKVTVHWWIWSFGHTAPDAVTEIDDLLRDAVIQMGFNPIRTQRFLLLTRTCFFLCCAKKIKVLERGVIKETDNYEIKIRRPDRNEHADCGKLMCFTFSSNTAQILVSTSRGLVIVYGYTIEYQKHFSPLDIDRLRFIKVVRLERRMINIIKYVDGLLVTGNSIGEIRFYDDQLKLLYWMDSLNVDKVKSLSFNISPRSTMILDPKCNKPCPCWEKVKVEKDPKTGEMKQKLIKMRLPSDATTSGKPFLVRDFIVTTWNQGVGFVDFVTEKYTNVLDSKISPILSMSVHPEKPFAVLGYTDGMVELIDFIKHSLITRLDLRSRYAVVVPPDDDSINCNYEVTVPELSVTYLKYSPSGLHLACGLNTGQLLFLDPSTIEILTPKPFGDTNDAIKHISFSPDSLLIATAFKYKIVNYETTMTLATVLGPRFEFPVSKVQLITRKDSKDIDPENSQYLLFSAKDIIGLQKMPLDGNPWKHVGMLGHPVRIQKMCFREDLGMLFTIGVRDTTMTQWVANYRAVEVAAARGGVELDPYYCLIDSGRPGWLFQEIRDLFYYIQILCQGTFSPARRRVKDYIPIDSLPDLMRALGFFPSEYEVENLIVEAKYKVFNRAPVSEIEFEEFVKLYLNHRPAFGEHYKRLRLAFRNFANISNEGYVMSREDLIDILTSQGERFSRELCWYLLSVLCGHSFEDRAVLNENDFSFLPEYITFSDFTTEIIGIQEMDNISDTYSGVESWASMHTFSSVDSDDKIL
ncbi:cilia- and flagella-associated protein 251-like isoform X2 [Trichoplusia ni]|uniref:Cilia- and flagella-associated protein 251 n=1 Tax=Trichoplusia ni TaxID=7111 RepID=A0A7E5WPT1_TRINI|nr:cilia- and flagella-associated protein 251-like isoform X2 [Trichoplusia ni]